MQDSYSSWLSHGWGLLLLIVSRKLDTWLCVHGLLDTYCYLFDGYTICLIHGWLLAYWQILLVGQDNGVIVDITIWRHGYSETWLTYLHNYDDFCWLSWLILIKCGMSPSDDTWLVYWGFLWKDHVVLDDDFMIIDYDSGVFTYDMMWMILCYYLEIWHMLSWFMEGYDKAPSTKETK